MSDQGGAGGTREPGGDTLMMASGGAEGGCSRQVDGPRWSGWRQSRGIHLPGRCWRAEDTKRIHTVELCQRRSGGRADRLAEFERGGGGGRLGGNSGETGGFELGRTSGDRRQRNLLFQIIIKIVCRGQLQLTFNGGSVGGAPFHPLELHVDSHDDR